MKHISGLFLLVFFSLNLCAAGDKPSDLSVVQSVAGNVLKEHSYLLLDKSTGSTYTDCKSLPDTGDFIIKSRFLEWRYVNGVLNMSMADLYKATGDNRYKDFLLKNYRFFFDNHDFFKKQFDKGDRNAGYFRFFRMGSLDDCGAMTGGLIEANKLEPRDDYEAYIKKTADYIIYKEGRLADGTLSRGPEGFRTVWLDDLYMGLSFLTKMASVSKDPVYLDFAAQQVVKFSQLLYEPRNGLYYHVFYEESGLPGVAHWGRANGWSIFAQTMLLSVMPENHPKRGDLLSIFRRQVLGFSRYQSESGLWHQLLDKNDSYLETSCTAMFTYAIAKGVNEGWLDRSFGNIALTAWEGIKSKIAENGDVSGICMGTGISRDMVFYYQRPTPLNDAHGLGAIIQAGLEVIKLKESINKTIK
jgi:rhamnogalacturonyl hydrolase YesR